MRTRAQRGAAAGTILLLLAALGATAQEKTDQGYVGFGADSVSPEALARFAPPPIDPQLRARVERTMDIRSPGAGRLAPDGETLFFTWGVTGTTQIWRVDEPKGFPVQMTGGEDSSRLLDITPDGRYLIISRDSSGDEQFGLYLQPTEGGELRTIFKGHKVRAGYEFVTDDSRSVYYRANDVRPDSYTIYRYDVEQGERETVFDREGLWVVADFEPDRGFLLSRLKGNLYADHFLWKEGSDALQPILGQDEMVEYGVAFAANDDEYVVHTNKFGEFRRLYRYRGGEFTPLSPELAHDVADFSIDDARKRIYYSVNRNGYYGAAVIDATTLEPVEMPALPEAEQVYFGSTTRDGRATTISLETARAPAAAYVYDWKTARLTQWVVPSTPEVDTSRFVRAELDGYPARDGTEVPMFVWRSDDCRKRACPVIVNFHGGPESQARPGFSPTTQLFVDAGFVYVRPNVRGSDGYGKAWLDADNGSARLDVLSDIEDCALHIRKAWARDGEAPKIGIYGGSYGGYSTLVGMTIYAGAYDAGVAVVGMSNLLT
ncbi:MAG TPA: prolyl oligopeptidase family serine peptidase, partial [Candidatus Polarisedimenticolaceae bacterium]|nr:prolyl oligopeptidase family serine peptidase [Candidatus Polarisedimenticolaceae bacterium]